jgi:hypothetical protein
MVKMIMVAWYHWSDSYRAVYNFNSQFKDGSAHQHQSGQPVGTATGTQLGNLNHKLKTMRDKLRNDIAQDMQYMHYKMGLNGE